MKKLTETVSKLDFYNKVDDSLREEFNKALKDEDFKHVIKRLLLDEDTLMKYTSKLQECVCEYSHCKDCKGLVECKNEINGFAFTPYVEDGRLTFSYVSCHYKKALIKKNKYQENIYYFDIPKEIKEAKMSNIYTNDKNRIDAISLLNDFIHSYSEDKEKACQGLYLYGNFGSGKTYLISAMFNELAKKDTRVAILYWPEFLRDLKASFDDDFKEKYNYAKKVPLLLIDDIGAENSTPWARDEILGPLLQYRMQERIPTFFTSNLSLEELETHFSTSNYKSEPVKAKRIIERIKQLSKDIRLVSKNNRK